jgi:hypothetical protein
MSYTWKSKSAEQIVKIVEQNHERLVKKRQVYEDLHNLIIKVFRPRLQSILRHSQLTKDKRFGATIYDQGPANALNKFVSGKLGYMVNRSVPWLQFVAPDARMMHDDPIKQYCQEAAEQTLWSASRSNLYSALVPCSLDADSVGTSVMIPMEDDVRDRVMFDVVHPRDSYLAVDKFGDPVVYHRRMDLTRMTAEERFGKDKLPDNWYKDDMLKEPFHEDEYMWCVYQNGDRDEASLLSEDKKWRVFCVRRGGGGRKIDGDRLVYRRGRDRFPVVYRTGRESGAEYGTSIAADCLTAALVVNKLGEKSLDAAHKIVDPPKVASATLRGRLHANASGTTYVDDINREGVKTWLDRIQWPISDAQMERLHGQIEDRMFIRFFEMFAAGEAADRRTAYEVSQMMGEKAVLMSMIIDTFEQECLEPSIVELMWHETEAGRMPDPPEQLVVSGGAVDIRYLGPLSQLQRSLLRAKGTIDGMAVVAQMREIWPDVELKFNWMEMAEDVAVSQGMPQKHIRSDEETEELVAQRRQQEQAMQMAAIAESAGKAAQGLSKAPEEGSPEEALLAGAGA